jgi:hypothetical protein
MGILDVPFPIYTPETPLDFSLVDAAINDIAEVPVPVNSRFSLVGYTDASFTVGETKDSTSGFVIFLNFT